MKGLDEKTGVAPFKLDSTSPGEQSCFEIIFYVQDTKYWYQLELDQKQVYLEKLSYYKTTQPIMLFERTLKDGQSNVQINPNGDKISPAAKDQINVNCLRNISFFVARNQVNASLPLIDAAKDWMRYHLMPIISPATSLTFLEKILFEFLKTPSRSQLIVTTHNDGLLDLVNDLIRKDSVWFTEKKKSGATELYKLNDFRGVNRLSSIREAYRNKRFGATMK